MTGIGRVGFMQRMTNIKDQVLLSQGTYVEDSLKLNSGNKILKISDDPAAVKKINEYSGTILEAKEKSSVKSSVESLLSISETAISDIKKILDDIKTDSLSASNATANDADRESYADVLLASTENLFRLANSKVNGQFIFSGKQSDKKTIDFNPDNLFFQNQYLEGASDQGPREIYGTNSSITLDDLFNSTASPAIISSKSAANATITSTSDIRLVIEDGNGNVFDTGNINLPAGTAMFPPALPNVVGIINTAANTVGLVGNIAQENPVGFLEFNTSLITGNKSNKSAAISIGNGTTLGSALNDFKITAHKTNGESQNIQNTLAELYKAYVANDVVGIRTAMVDLDANVSRAINKQTLTGELKNRFEESRIRDEDQTDSLKLRKSSLEDIPIAEAIVNANKSKLVLDNVLRNASSLASANIFNFLSF
jgi:flagellin-like hook-associated protein FlgL